MRDHHRLRVFADADALVLTVYGATRAFPAAERFCLGQQLRRSCLSIVSNIVEGSARRTTADYRHFLDMAYASATEAEYQIGLAGRLGLLDASSTRSLSAQATSVAKQLNALVNALPG